MATSERSSSRTKIWLVAGGIVVLAGVAYVATIYPPDNESLAGSVTPADRYRGESATRGSGSVLGDQSIAQFMQTDMYQMIVSDRVLANAFASEGFRQALASDNFKQALASDNFKQALASDNFKQAMASDQFRAALASDQFRAALGQDAMRAVAQTQ